MLTESPVPSSKPAATVSRGTMSIHQWNGRAIVARRGLDHDVVRDRAEHACRSARSRRVSAIAERARPRRRCSSKRRAAVGEREAHGERRRSTRAGTTTTAPSSRTMQFARAPRRSRRRRDRARRRRSGRGVVDVRRHEVERDELRVRMLDRRARGLALVDERLRVHEPGVEVEARRGRAARASTSAAPSGESAPSSASCAGERITTSCAPGDAVLPTIGYMFGHDADVQPGVSGSPAPSRATSGGVVPRCPRQNGQVGDGSPVSGSASDALNVSGRSRAAGREDDRSPVSSSTRSCCIEGSG